MHATKYAILVRTGPNAWPIVFAAAKKYRVSVDDVVSAGLSRGNVSTSAVQAARDVVKQLPNVFDQIGNDWPYDCPFCLQIVDVRDGATCAFCSKIGCSECVTPRGCPLCLERNRQERQAAEQRALQAKTAAA